MGESIFSADTYSVAYSELHEKESELVIAASTPSVVYIASPRLPYFNILKETLKMYVN